jgi:hypothetical protein
MNTYNIVPLKRRRQRQPVVSLIYAERTQAVRRLAGRFNMSISTAVMVAHAAGLDVGADR